MYGSRCVLVDSVREVGVEECCVVLPDRDVGAVEIPIVDEYRSVQIVLSGAGPAVVPDMRLVQPQGEHGDPDVTVVVDCG